MAAISSNKVLPPPSERYNVLGWIRRRLFSTWYNGLLTVLGLLVSVLAIRGFIIWAFTQAQWEVIPTNLRLFMVGQYPPDQLWRIWIGLFLIALIIGFSWGVWGSQLGFFGVILGATPLLLAILPFSLEVRLRLIGLSVLGLAGWGAARLKPSALSRLVVIAWILLFPVFLLLVNGLSGETGWMPRVPTNFWGGLLLTFTLTVVGIVVSFPIGILLALGRRSDLAVMRLFCVAYIELVRGVPLITLLFMAQLMLPLFLPANITIDRVVRATTGIILFSAAYLAENVRGGLQAIPKGQYEAAHALGLNGFQTTVRIILPQALRAVIPILVGQFIALFKDTTLVAIVGLFDLLGIARTVLAQPDFIGRQLEVLTFIGAIYWIFSYLMSYFSQRLETVLGVGKR
ncbi:MAG: amino acid ABC transporter permease [Anaerolineales bacterium]|jgi:general L-amino acid transport system permease protein